MYQKKILIPVILFILIMPLSTQSNADSPEGTWNCYLVTVGPGDPLYIWFGHTGLILEYTANSKARFYDFGNFSFKSDHFYRNFAMGRLIYSSVGVSARAYLNYIANENRDVTIQALNLSQRAIADMAQYLEWKVSPGNNTYLYHHYLDNCSTRIRDLIDTATGGQLKEATMMSAGTSFRESFRRYSSHSWWADWLLSFLQGRTIDRDITVWDTMFLPDELMIQVGKLTIETENGTEALVRNTEYRVKAEGREAVPDTAPSNIKMALVYGLISGICLLLLQAGALSRKNGPGNTCRILLTLFLTVFSVTGGLTFFISLFTNHQVASENLNLMVIHPFYLVLIFLFPKRNNPRRIKILVRFWQIQALLFIGMILINLLPGFHQGNERTVFLFLPLLLLQLAGLPLITRNRTTSKGQSSGLLNRAISLKPGRADRGEP